LDITTTATITISRIGAKNKTASPLKVAGASEYQMLDKEAPEK
jgi:hypothetical protein